MPRAPSKHRFRPLRRDPVVTTALLVAVCVTILGGCTKPAPPRTPQAPTKIRVAAATDLRSCLDALTDAFQVEHPNFDLLPTFGASGALLTQLKSGLETDLYLSADIAYAHDLAAAGLAAEADVFESGQGRLVVWVRNESPIDVVKLGAEALLDTSVHRVAIANPVHAPYGRAAVAALEHLGLHDRLREKLAVGESAAQAAQYVESGAAEVGILPMALARGTRLSERGRFWVVPADAHPPIRHGGAIHARAIDREATVAFRDFLLSPAGRAVLARYGFEFPAVP
jgi:molybdate transport system substrate-binding protein